jgi:malate permease and related proteins
MNTFVITLQAVFTLLGIGVLGFWVIGHRKAPSAIFGFLSTLAIDIALPFLVLANLIKDFSPQNFPDWWRLPIWWVGFTVVTLILALLSSPIAKKGNRSEYMMALVYQNGIFFPLIIITGLMGTSNTYLGSLFVFMALQPSLVFSTYYFFYRGNSQVPKFNWTRIINPVLVTTLVGLIVSLLAIKQYIPDFILNILTLVGAMSTPLFMLILGGNIYNDFRQSAGGQKRFDFGEVAKFVVVKNVVFPLVFLGLLIWIRPDPIIAFIIILQAAVPPITAIPIFADRCGGNRAAASQFILGSFLVSVISIPVMIYIFNLKFTLPI